MKIYDEQIINALRLLEGDEGRILKGCDLPWEDAGKQNLVLRGEMAYELGAGTMPAVSFLGITTSETLVPQNQTLLYGQDLPEITSDRPYARITLIRVEEGKMGRGEGLYDKINQIASTRYKVNPKGFMSRISTGNNHEPVRVSKAALEDGLNFEKVARLYREAYEEHPEVLAVQVIFVTLPHFNYNELLNLTQKNNQITAALDHILRDVKMDCSSCNLQLICSEVEGLKGDLVRG